MRSPFDTGATLSLAGPVTATAGAGHKNQGQKENEPETSDQKCVHDLQVVFENLQKVSQPTGQDEEKTSVVASQRYPAAAKINKRVISIAVSTQKGGLGKTTVAIHPPNPFPHHLPPPHPPPSPPRLCCVTMWTRARVHPHPLFLHHQQRRKVNPQRRKMLPSPMPPTALKLLKRSMRWRLVMAMKATRSTPT